LLYRSERIIKDGESQNYNGNFVTLRVRHGANVFLFSGDNHGIAGVAKFAIVSSLKEYDTLSSPMS
jgi:hypothetical protein